MLMVDTVLLVLIAPVGYDACVTLSSSLEWVGYGANVTLFS